MSGSIRRTTLVTPLLALALAPAALAAQAPTPAARARVDAIFAEYDRPDRPGAAVAVLKDGEIVLERGYGSAQLEHGIPVTPATVFHVASVTKQFTAAAVVLLAQRGALSLDDEIHRHLPELPDLGRPVTVRQLIHHTSGIRDQWELLAMAGWRLDDVITKDHILRMMARQRELNFEPGAEYLYSNMGYTLLAEIVERVGGKPFPAWMEENVFAPLGMRSTHMHDDHTHVVPGRAYSYRRDDDGTWRNAVLSYANAGATSLFTTAGDLARWLRNYETGQVGGPAFVAQMRTRGVLLSGDTIPYAFAIGRGEHRGRVTWSHGGADAGFRSIVMHVPDERLGVVVLGSDAAFNPGRLAAEVLDVYLGATPAVAPPLPPPSANAGSDAGRPAVGPAERAAYAGVFYSPELETVYRIVESGDRLVARHQRNSDVVLTPAATDTFAGDAWFFRRVAFTRSATGAVDGFRLTGGRVRNLRFVRLPDSALPVAAAPQAGSVAFVSNRDGNYELYLAPLDGGATVNLTNHPATDYGLSWSPDGRRLLFGTDRDGNREIYVMDADGSSARNLTNHAASDAAPAWSPDGRRIAFVSNRDGNSEIYLMDADGSNIVRVTTNDRYDEVPAWSPDGSRIAFGAVAGTGDDATLQIFVIDADGGGERQLTTLPGHNSAPRWSPDGSRIAFYGNVGERFVGADIFTMAPDGSGLTNLTDDAEPDWQPDWSPDGRWIVFARGAGDPLDLWVMRSDGTDRRRITDAAGRDEMPYWRPGAR